MRKILLGLVVCVGVLSVSLHAQRRPLSPADIGAIATLLKLEDTRQYDEAASYLEEAIARAPNWSEPRIALGLLETQTGRDDKSRTVLTEATKLDPFNKRAQNSLFLLNSMQGWVRFEGKPHLIARLPDHELWMAFFRDPDENLLALMSEVRK